MTRALVLAAAAAAVAATPRVGVCWTRNNLPADPAAAALALARVVASARSLRRSEANVLGTCLYTDRKDVARRALATSNASPPARESKQEAAAAVVTRDPRRRRGGG